MLATFTSFSDRLRRSALAIPVAVLAAGLMLAISETAYFGADSRLRGVVKMGTARIQMMHLLRRVTEAETSKRGYMLTNGKEYLDPYRHARLDAQASLEKLQSYYAAIGDDVAERKRQRIERIVNTKLSEMEEVLRLFDAGRREEAMELVASGIGRDTMDELRREIDELVAYQNERIAGGLTNVFDTLQLNRIGIAAITAVSLMVLLLFLRQGKLMDEQQAIRQAEIAAERDHLEREVARRTAELTELARHLQSAREDERARLARELHDELGALLTAAKLDVARLRPKLQQTMPDMLPRLAHLTDSLNGGIALKRRIIEDLRPSTLSNLGLCPSLEILCNEFAQRSGIAVHADIQPVHIAPGADLTVFRMVQESLTNVAKYAQARNVWVSLGVQGEQAVATVRDDGVGFDAEHPLQGRHGLAGMRFRLEAERGLLTVSSAPGQGTVVTARLPLSDEPPPSGDAGSGDTVPGTQV